VNFGTSKRLDLLLIIWLNNNIVVPIALNTCNNKNGSINELWTIMKLFQPIRSRYILWNNQKVEFVLLDESILISDYISIRDTRSIHY
jgi:hypothetical protein